MDMVKNGFYSFKARGRFGFEPISRYQHTPTFFGKDRQQFRTHVPPFVVSTINLTSKVYVCLRVASRNNPYIVHLSLKSTTQMFKNLNGPYETIIYFRSPDAYQQLAHFSNPFKDIQIRNKTLRGAKKTHSLVSKQIKKFTKEVLKLEKKKIKET